MATYAPEDAAKMHDRISKIEWQTESLDTRLTENAKVIDGIRACVDDVREDIHDINAKVQRIPEKRPISLLSILLSCLGMAAGLCVFVGVLIWNASRYPDRSEFEKRTEDRILVEKELRSDIDLIRTQQSEIHTNQMLIKASVQRQEQTQEKINEKIDKLLEGGAARR